MATRWESEGRPSAAEYDARWAGLAASGENPHGEADFVLRSSPGSVLDAGCGTGRVARELHRRGIEVVGVDLGAGVVAHARAQAPEIEWRHADLMTVDLGRQFDVVVAAGNVMIFLASRTEAAVLANLARHLGPGGRLISGFQLQSGEVLEEFDRYAGDAGLELVERYATWAGAEYTGAEDIGGGYAVSVHVWRDPEVEGTH